LALRTHDLAIVRIALDTAVKILYLYRMASRLVNVRLDPERVQKALWLRASGVSLSELVRDAIDERYEALSRPVRAREVRETVTRIFERFPDPPDLPARTYDVHDRRTARAAVARRLRTGRK
jgi:hypothetical protein